MGVDYQPSFQQIAFFEEETGECGERQLNHSDGQAERYSSAWPNMGGIRILAPPIQKQV